MTHIHWVSRQNKLEMPNDEEKVNTREIHKCDGQVHDPDTMVAPLTPKPTRKAKALVKSPPTIDSQKIVPPGVVYLRVKREVKRVYRNGCRYNERLNSETGGSKTTRTHWVTRVNI
jgi:hypothetical protein